MARTGSGKSTVAQRLLSKLTEEGVKSVVVPMDGYLAPLITDPFASAIRVEKVFCCYLFYGFRVEIRNLLTGIALPCRYHYYRKELDLMPNPTVSSAMLLGACYAIPGTGTAAISHR